MPAQKVRVWFRKGDRVRYITHLDVLRYWERVFRRAGLPLGYSQGFTPHPKLAFAAPLPHGFVAEREIVDATLDARVAPDVIRAAIDEQSSPDIAAVEVAEIPLDWPSPQATLEWADYRFDVPGVAPAALAAAVAGFLARETFEWLDERREKPRAYDMRAGVRSLSVSDESGLARVEACLSAGQDFTVRPEELLKALSPGAAAPLYVRAALYLAGDPVTAAG